MRGRFLIGALLVLAVSALAAAQSLTELAKEERERRKKNKEKGEQVQVITEKELAENTGTIANPSDATSIPSPSSGAAQTPAPAAGESEDDSADDDSADDDVPDDVAADASLEEKLRIFESMKAGYFERVREIDQEIQKNNGRQAEIQEELVSTGGTGLPTAPRADMTPRNPADIPALRREQQELRDQNQALEAQKKNLKDDLLRKGSSAGIPPGYLRF